MSLRPSLCVAGASELEGLSLPPAGERRHSELLFTHHRLWWGWITGGARGLWKKRSNQMRRSEAMHWRHKQLIDRGMSGDTKTQVGCHHCFLFLNHDRSTFQGFNSKKEKKKKEKVPSDLSTQSNISQTGVGFFAPFQDELFNHKIIVRCFYSYTSWKSGRYLASLDIFYLEWLYKCHESIVKSRHWQKSK